MFFCLRKLSSRSLLWSEDDHDVKQHKKWLMIQENHTKEINWDTGTNHHQSFGHWVAHRFDYQWLFREMSPRFPQAHLTPPPSPPPPRDKSIIGLSLLGWNPKNAGNRALVAHRATTGFLHYCGSYPSREAFSQLWFREPSGSNTDTVSGLLHRSAGFVSHKNWHWRLRAKPHTQW